MDDDPAAFPIPKRIESEADWVFTAEEVGRGFPAKNKQEHRWQFDLHEPTRLPDDEEFTLSAFGLPEPPGLEWKKPTPWYLWLGLAGIGCLVLGAGVRWFRRTKAERVNSAKG